MLLDESGSMSVRASQTVSGFNEYIEKAKTDFPGATFTLMRFDSSKQDITIRALPIKSVRPLADFMPGALTPLYDAIGKVVKFAESLAGKVFVVIITDGQENASQEYDRKAIFDLIKRKEADGWAFSYLGIHADAWGEAQKIGTQACYTAQAGTVQKAYELSNNYAMSYFNPPGNTDDTDSGFKTKI
jgi:hypothetical protein